MGGTDAVAEFAAVLRGLKERSGRSFAALAHRTGTSSSTLHRYCAGTVLPPDFRLVGQLAAACGANRRELARLRRLWEFAEAAVSEVTAATVAERPGGDGWRPRNELPRDIGDFTGRDAELDALLAAVVAADGRTVPVHAIDGMGGVGKTSLVVRCAHRLAQRYPDGQFFVDLHAHTPGHPPLSPAAALETLLRAVDVPGESIPPTVEQRAALWRSTLAGRRVLLVLDNAADAAHVRPLIPGHPGCLTLVTSRRRLTDLDGASTLALDVLREDEAVGLFLRIAGSGRGEDAAVRECVRLCGYLPLAIRIAAARLRDRPVWTVEHLNQRLGRNTRRPTELNAVFALSHQYLDDAQRRMFRLLGLHPGADVDVHAAAALAGIAPLDAEDLLESLVDVHLVQQREPGRYQLHDLLREHAASTASAEEDPAALTEALDRLWDYYLAAASLATRAYERAESSEEEPDERLPDLADHTVAARWLEAERANLVAVVEHCTDEHAWRISLVLWQFFLTRGYSQDWLRTHEAALAATDRLGDLDARAEILKNLGMLNWRLGRVDQALAQLQEALERDLATGNERFEARTRGRLGLLHDWRGDYEEAVANFARSDELYQKLGVDFGRAPSILGLGSAYRQRGDFTLARKELDRALTLSEATGDLWAQSLALTNLGLIDADEGDDELARSRFERALELSERLGDRWSWGLAISSLGAMNRRLGNYEEALRYQRRALDNATQGGDRWAMGLAHIGLGKVHHLLGERERAREHLRLALEYAEELGNRKLLAEARAALDTFG
ncbi:tetratricopeptide repeat protein [Allokutzneria sp. A3M-2-11 16]|uniref:ATP-binding protein n=1 Tax=Allokutzneria sp. A3M-2-11 16 TaxID=2962043 RepID=UPI0020B6F409|nr:XRE family transcriptional regulator [Allokutzneria sp. A3M-2-11 16]MCP3801522.1 tetratricopeptide repeat protein [Allokutzneria sp. A3M-2-11 16]